MTRLRPFATAAAAAMLLAAASTHAAAPAECPKRLIEKPEVDPATGKETRAAREAREELEMVVNVLVMYQSCSDGNPEFATNFRPAYQLWRNKFSAAIGRYEKNAHARRYVECGLRKERERAAADSPAGKANKARVCNDLMGPGIDRITNDGPG